MSADQSSAVERRAFRAMALDVEHGAQHVERSTSSTSSGAESNQWRALDVEEFPRVARSTSSTSSTGAAGRRRALDVEHVEHGERRPWNFSARSVADRLSNDYGAGWTDRNGRSAEPKGNAMRVTPNTENTGGAQSDAAAIAAALDVVDVAAATDIDDVCRASIVRTVREWTPQRRTDAVVALATGGAIPPALISPVSTCVMGAPTGPDPVDVVADHLAQMVDDVAALTLGARDVLDAASDDRLDVVEMLSAALTRVTPATADDVSAATTPQRSTSSTGERRRRRSVARSWTRDASGEWHYAASATTGADAGVITVSTAGGRGRFTTADGREFTSPTAALRHAQGWDAAGLSAGWGNPFDVLTRERGGRRQTLGEVTAV